MMSLLWAKEGNYWKIVARRAAYRDCRANASARSYACIWAARSGEEDDVGTDTKGTGQAHLQNSESTESFRHDLECPTGERPMEQENLKAFAVMAMPDHVADSFLMPETPASDKKEPC